MHIQPDRAVIPAGLPATRYLSITLAAPPAAAPASGAARPARPGVDVSLVLDRSGSMADRKIALARQAVAHAIRLLKPDDRLNVVVYDDRVDTLLERTAATGEAKRRALGALDRIDARGSTDLAAGWFTGARALGAVPDRAGDGAGSGTAPSDRVRRVLLLTDGLANVGVVDHRELGAAAGRLRSQGVNTSTFGLGADFDEDLLTTVATAGGGHFYFIEHPQQIPDFFTSELGEVLDIVARDVAFEIVAGPDTAVSILNGLPVERDGPVTRVRLGDFVADQEVTLHVAVHIDPRAEGEMASVLCRVRDRDQAMTTVAMQLDWRAVAVAQDREQPVNQAVLAEVARMLAERARMAALSANREGDFRRAGGALDDAAEQIRRLGLDDDFARHLARQLLREKDEFAEAMSPGERKRRHFAGYNLSLSREAGKAKRRVRS